jgi:hypothetical protein
MSSEGIQSLITGKVMIRGCQYSDSYFGIDVRILTAMILSESSQKEIQAGVVSLLRGTLFLDKWEVNEHLMALLGYCQTL